MGKPLERCKPKHAVQRDFKFGASDLETSEDCKTGLNAQPRVADWMRFSATIQEAGRAIAKKLAFRQRWGRPLPVWLESNVTSDA